MGKEGRKQLSLSAYSLGKNHVQKIFINDGD